MDDLFGARQRAAPIREQKQGGAGIAALTSPSPPWRQSLPLRGAAAAGRGVGTLRRVAVPILSLIIAANFLGYALAGSNGILRLDDIRRLTGERRAALGLLDQEQAKLFHHAELLASGSIDADLADEMVRRGLGVIRPDEVIIPIGD